MESEENPITSLIEATLVSDEKIISEASNQLIQLLNTYDSFPLLIDLIKNPKTEIIQNAAYLYLLKWSRFMYSSLSIGQKLVFLSALIDLLKEQPNDYQRNFICSIYRECLNKNVEVPIFNAYLFENEPNIDDYRLTIIDILFDCIPQEVIRAHSESILQASHEVLSTMEDVSKKINILHLMNVTIMLTFNGETPEELKEFILVQIQGVLETIKTLSLNDQQAFASICGGIVSSCNDLLEHTMPLYEAILGDEEINASVKFIIYSFLSELFQNGVLDESLMVSVIDGSFTLFAETFEEEPRTDYIAQIFDNISDDSFANIHQHILELCAEALGREEVQLQIAALYFIKFGIESFSGVSQELFELFNTEIYPHLADEGVASEFICISLRIIEEYFVSDDFNDPAQHLIPLIPCLFSDDVEIRLSYLTTIKSLSSASKYLKPVLVSFIEAFAQSGAEPDDILVTSLGDLVYGSEDLEEEIVSTVLELSLAFLSSCNEENQLLSGCITMFSNILMSLPQLYEPVMEQLLPILVEVLTELTQNEYSNIEMFTAVLNFISQLLVNWNGESPLLSQEELAEFLQWNLTNTFKVINLENIAFCIRIEYATLCSITEMIPPLLTQIYSSFENMKFDELVCIAPLLPQFCTAIAKEDLLKIITNLFSIYCYADTYGYKFTLLNAVPPLLDLFSPEDFAVVDPIIDARVGEFLKLSDNVEYFNIAWKLLLFGLKRGTENSIHYLTYVIENLMPSFKHSFYEYFMDSLFDCIEAHAIPDEVLPIFVEPLTSFPENISGFLIQTYVCLINKIIQNYEAGTEMFSELVLSFRGWEAIENDMIIANLASLYMTVASKVEDFDEEMLAFAVSHYPPVDEEEVASMTQCILQIKFPESVLPVLLQGIATLLGNEEYKELIGEELFEAIQSFYSQYAQ